MPDYFRVSGTPFAGVYTPPRGDEEPILLWNPFVLNTAEAAPQAMWERGRRGWGCRVNGIWLGLAASGTQKTASCLRQTLLLHPW